METNEATPKSWTIKDWIHDHERLSDEITRLTKEHAALCAVADAAQQHAQARTGGDWRKWLELYRHDVRADKELLMLCITLENLAKRYEQSSPVPVA